MPFASKKLDIPDVLLITPKVFDDERGFFKEVYKLPDFFALGIQATFRQINHSLSKQNTLRGLHYQKRPFAQAKLVRVLRGEIFDVAVDIRQGSPYYAKHVGVPLSAQGHQMIFIPEGFAHGFVTLSTEAEIEYLSSDIYAPQCDQGIIYNDLMLNIHWPVREPLVSERDKLFPQFKDIDTGFTYKK